MKDCRLRQAQPGELDRAGQVLGPLVATLRDRMIVAGLSRLAMTHWRFAPGTRPRGRHFASCRRDGRDLEIHRELVLLPTAQQAGIVAHELGHAADFLYPAELEVEEGLWRRRTPTPRALEVWERRDEDAIERDADALASAVLGLALGYTGPCDLQTLGAQGPRPKGLR